MEDSADCQGEQHHIDVVIMLGLFIGPDSLERSTLHSALNQE